MDQHASNSRSSRRRRHQRRSTRPLVGRPLVVASDVVVIDERRGSVLLVVIGMLALLLLVGFTFFTFAQQEQTAAEFNAGAAKKFEVTIETDALLNAAMRQLIVGPRSNEPQSVLYPGVYSMLPNLIGPLDAVFDPATGQFIARGVNASPNPYQPNNPRVQHRYTPRNLHPNVGGQSGLIAVPNAGLGFPNKTAEPWVPGALSANPPMGPVPPWHRLGGNGTGINLLDGGLMAPPAGFVGLPYPDQDQDGFADNGVGGAPDNRGLLFINRSPAATMLDILAQGYPREYAFYLPRNFPSMTPGYSYPDVNNLFLAYFGADASMASPTPGSTLQLPGGASPNASIFVPSFHRPVLLRQPSATGFADPIADWPINTTAPLSQHSGATTPTMDPLPNLADINNPLGFVGALIGRDVSGVYRTGTGRLVFRPHPSHLNVNSQSLATQVRRYLTAPAPVVDPNTGMVVRTIRPFPFYPGYPAPPVPATRPLATGAWDGIAGDPARLPTVMAETVSLDEDNNGDGDREGVWLDLGYPTTPLPDGRFVQPLFSFTVVPLDALINLNTSGNTSGIHNVDATNPLGLPAHGTGEFQRFVRNARLFGSPVQNAQKSISRSNLGLSPSEVNPYWALSRFRSPGATDFIGFAPYRGFFYGDGSLPAASLSQVRASSQMFLTDDANRQSYNLANMDLVFLNWGRPNYNVVYNAGADTETFTVSDLVEGRWTHRQTIAPSYTPLAQVPGFTMGIGTNLYSFLTPPAAINGGVPQTMPAPGLLPSVFMADPPITYADALNFEPGDDDGDRFEGWGNNPLTGTALARSLAVPEAIVSYTPLQGGLTPGGAVQVATFGHPLDYTGSGSFTVENSTGGSSQQAAIVSNVMLPDSITPGTPRWSFPTPFRWIQYSDFVTRDSIDSTRPRGYQASTTYALGLGLIRNELGITSAHITSSGYGPFFTVKSGTNFGNLDEADETIADRNFKMSLGRSDQVFGPDEIAALQLSQGDFARVGLTSRVLSLTPGTLGRPNVDLNGSALELNAPAIRGMFTTESWDRRQHAWAMLPDRAWEFNADTDWTQASSNLVMMTPNGRGEFPPAVLDPANSNVRTGARVFANTGSYINMSLQAFTQADPIRPELRSVIGCEPNNAFQTRNRAQERLNINRLAVFAPGLRNVQYFQNSSANYIVPVSGRVRYRELTPHPNMASVGPAVSVSAIVQTELQASPARFGMPRGNEWAFYPYNPGLDLTDPAQLEIALCEQEFWARRDRQQLARDIYVLLYYANAPDGVDPTSIPVYTVAQCAQMAQVAVNLVDSLDRDDAITKFEYDTNLSNGWGLGDDPYDTLDDDSTTAADRQIAFGVEDQVLSFSEILAMRQNDAGAVAGDYPGTPWTDNGQGARGWAYLELANVSTQRVDLSGGHWRIRLLDTSNPSGNGPAERRLVIRPNPGTYTTVGDRRRFVWPGSNFVISSASRTDTFPNGFWYSDFRVRWDSTTDNRFRCLAPARESATLNPPATATDWTNFPPMANLDLLAHHTTSPNAGGSGPTHFRVFDSGDNPIDAAGAFIGNGGTPVFDTATRMIFVLERRQNLQRNAWNPSTNLPSLVQDNGWIEVDRIDFTVETPISFNSGDTDGTFQQKVGGLSGSAVPNWMRSRERVNPLTRAFERRNTYSTSDYPRDLSPVSPIPYQFTRNTLGLDVGNAFNDGGSFVANSVVRRSAAVGTPNELPSVLPNGYNLWLPHFNRDFAGINDLMVLPAYGPSYTESGTGATYRLTLSQNFAWLDGTLRTPCTVTNSLLADGRNTAGHNIFYRNGLVTGPPGTVAPASFPVQISPSGATGNLVPSVTNNVRDQSSGATQFSSRYHRVLELLEVPSRANMQTERQVGTRNPRVPGKIDINNIRHPEVLMALLDDARQINQLNMTDNLEASRNWWRQFVWSRDQIDPLTQMPLPGSTVSRPFRSYSFERGGMASTVVREFLNPLMGTYTPLSLPAGNVEHTLLRSLKEDRMNSVLATGSLIPTASAAPVANRRSFTALAASENLGGGLGMQQWIDPYTANRLQSKLMNLSTNRSNVFAVWVTVRFFEAYQNPADPTNRGLTQVGGYLTDTSGTPVPPRRAFFVVDRSLLEDAFDPVTRTINWQRFVIFKQILQDQ